MSDENKDLETEGIETDDESNTDDDIIKDPRVQEYIKGLKENKDEILDKYKKTEKELRALKQKQQQLEETDNNPDKDNDSGDPKEVYQKRIEKLENELTKIKEDNKNKTINSALHQSLLNKDIDPEYVDMAMQLLKTQKSLNTNSEDGQIYAEDGSTLEEIVSEFTENKGKIFKKSSENRGVKTSRKNKTSVPKTKKASEMTEAEVIEFVKEYGADEYAKLP